jgi:MarR family transcriptional regulator for hemolysin
MSITYTRLLQFFQQYTKYCDHQFLPVLERTGITMREVHVLLFLANNPNYDTARDITVLRGISKSQVSQAVDLLAAEGFLTRTADPVDRRVVHLAISQDGWPLAQECQNIQDFCGEQLVKDMSAEEIETLRTLFDTVLDNGTRLAEEVPS